jgi:hypothetical protein
MTSEFHVTSISNGAVYGHDTSHCDASGCNGDEMYLGDTVEIQADVGDTVELEFTENESLETKAARARGERMVR